MAVNLLTKEFEQNRYAIYKQLREHDPVPKIDPPYLGGDFFVTRYDDVMAVLKDPRFSSERRKVTGEKDSPLRKWLMPGVLRAVMKSMVVVDDPDHARLRNLVHKAFTPRLIQQMEVRIKEISNSLLDEAAQKQTSDLMADFAILLPLTVISEMMGVPPHDRPKFRKLMTGLVEGLTATSAMSKLAQIPTMFALNRFLKDLIALRQRDPQDDLISALVQAKDNEDKLSEEELVSMLFLLLLAGHETTVNLIGNGILTLLEHPDQLKKLTADLSLVDSAIEEILRFTNPVQHVGRRYALEDIELGNQRIPKGSTVIVGIASANRDETVFPNPDEFDITRTPNRHVAFGMGIHYCLGAPLARLEARNAFNILFTRFPNLKLAVPHDQLEWREGPGVQGLKSLPIRLKG